MIKIIVTGAYSTGKSSLVIGLADRLRARGRTVRTLDDVARDCPVPLNGDQTEAATLWLLTTQIAWELAAAQGSEDVLLCDRGVPDIMAHYRDVASRAPGSLVADLDAFVDRWLDGYDLMLFSRIDPRISVAADGLRVPDDEYRAKLDGFAEDGLHGRSNVKELPNGDEERLNYASELITRALEA